MFSQGSDTHLASRGNLYRPNLVVQVQQPVCCVSVCMRVREIILSLTFDLNYAMLVYLDDI